MMREEAQSSGSSQNGQKQFDQASYPCPADCRAGRAFVGQFYLADKRIIDFDFLPVCGVSPVFAVVSSVVTSFLITAPNYFNIIALLLNKYELSYKYKIRQLLKE